MIFRPYYYFDTGCAAYLFGCGSEGKCAVVDPQERDVDAYVDFAAAKGMRITHVIDTHVHADHLSGGRRSPSGSGPILPARIRRGRLPLRPAPRRRRNRARQYARRPCSTRPATATTASALLVTDLRRGPEPWFVLTGDTLFVGSVGRPDLHAHAREIAAQLYDSLHAKLMTLPDDIEIYPGHFSGSLCGAGMSGKPSSTIAFEKRWNPLPQEVARRVRRGACGRAAEAGRHGGDPPRQPGASEPAA